MLTYREIGERARQVRDVPLKAVLEATGAKRDRRDKAKWHTARGVLSVTGMKFINWNQGQGGGGAIDLAMHLKNLGFKAAVQWLWDHFPGHLPPQPPQPATKPTLQLPPRDHSKLRRVRRYLIRDRHLPPSLVKPLIESGTLYADNHANAVFVMLRKENSPVGAELRGTGTRHWRGMAPGSKKDAGYFSLHPPHATTIVLCESAIDAISCSVLHPDSWCISTSGARTNPRWLSSLIDKNYRIYCGFDSDPTGDSMAEAMIACHPTVKRLRPAPHDWNDALKSQS